MQALAREAAGESTTRVQHHSEAEHCWPAPSEQHSVPSRAADRARAASMTLLLAKSHNLTAPSMSIVSLHANSFASAKLNGAPRSETKGTETGVRQARFDRLFLTHPGGISSAADILPGPSGSLLACDKRVCVQEMLAQPEHTQGHAPAVSDGLLGEKVADDIVDFGACATALRTAAALRSFFSAAAVHLPLAWRISSLHVHVVSALWDQAGPERLTTERVFFKCWR